MRKRRQLKKKPFIFMLIILLAVGIGSFYVSTSYNDIEEYQVDNLSIQHQFLTVNPYSRSGKTLRRVNGIVIHYTANPGSTAQNNRDYFENLKNTKTTSASSHFIIGLDGEIIQCIPLNEIAYASNNRNRDTISIECCHPNKSGKFSAATQTALIQLCAWLCGNYGMDTSDIIRHYDVTGKMCPKYYVKHKDAWTTLKKNISIELSRYSKKETEK